MAIGVIYRNFGFYIAGHEKKSFYAVFVKPHLGQPIVVLVTIEHKRAKFMKPQMITLTRHVLPATGLTS